MLQKIKSIAFYYGLPLLVYALIILLTFIVSNVWSFSLDLTSLIIALLIATSWFLGRNPGVLIAIVFEATLVYFQTAPYSTKSAVITFNRLALFITLVIFTSSRKKAEQILRDQRETLKVTISSIGDAVIATELDGKINFINPAAEKLTGWTSDEACGQPIEKIFKIISEESYQPVENPFSAVIRKGIIVGLANHTILVSKDGSEIPIEDSGAPIRDTAGNIIGVVVVFHDVSEARRIEKERELLLKNEQLARKEAELAGRLKDEFLATVSHELRTPLNSILGWASILNNSNLEDENIINACRIIERNAKNQAKIIGDILDISQIITGKLQLQTESLELAPVIRASIETLQPAASAKSIAIKLSLDENVGKIVGDSDRLQQIIWNLVSNAIKFTPNHGEIKINLLRAASHVELKITDNGIGISEQFLPFVFDRFRQMDSSITRTYGGLGLGLSIVKQLVELHGGTVSVESEGEGKGSLFTVCLLAAEEKDFNSPSPVESKLPESFKIPKMFKENLKLQGLRVLVVDDDIDTLEMLNFALQGFGAEVMTADSAAAASQSLLKGRFDVIVSDLGMPYDDGFTLMGKIRNSAQDRFTPAVAVSGYARSEDYDRAIAAGFQNHLTKPVDIFELTSVILELTRNQNL